MAATELPHNCSTVSFTMAIHERMSMQCPSLRASTGALFFFKQRSPRGTVKTPQACTPEKASQ